MKCFLVFIPECPLAAAVCYAESETQSSPFTMIVIHPSSVCIDGAKKSEAETPSNNNTVSLILHKIARDPYKIIFWSEARTIAISDRRNSSMKSGLWSLAAITDVISCSYVGTLTTNMFQVRAASAATPGYSITVRHFHFLGE
jgi:hypothetical protein